MNRKQGMSRAVAASSVLCLVVAVLLLSACGQEIPPEPTIIRLPVEEMPSPALTWTATAAPTGTPVSPAATPNPTSSPTSAPTPELSAGPAPQAPSTTTRPSLEGRFVFQVASGGDIYVVNADGTGLIRLAVGVGP